MNERIAEIEALEALRNLHINDTHKGMKLSVVLTHAAVAIHEQAAKDAEIERLSQLAMMREGEIGDRDREIGLMTEAQRWIPVTERLPEVGKCVLVRQTYHAFIGDHGEYEGITVGYLHQPTDKRRMPYFYYAAVSDYGDKVRAESICPGQEFVTHWMPLPSAPEEGAEK